MVPLPCSGTGHTEDNAAIADGHGSQWQQKEAAEGEEVIGGLLPSSLEAAFGDTLSEGDWASSADSTKQEQLGQGKQETKSPGCSQKFTSS